MPLANVVLVFTAAVDENEELMKEIKELSHKVHTELKSALVS